MERERIILMEEKERVSIKEGRKRAITSRERAYKASLQVFTHMCPAPRMVMKVKFFSYSVTYPAICWPPSTVHGRQPLEFVANDKFSALVHSSVPMYGLGTCALQTALFVRTGTARAMAVNVHASVRIATVDEHAVSASVDERDVVIVG